MQNTVVVVAHRIVQHPKYRKRYRISTKYKADSKEQPCQTGDFVLIEECRPISKDKRWKVIKMITKTELEAKAEEDSLEMKDHH